jgi:hypothetical protein
MNGFAQRLREKATMSDSVQAAFGLFDDDSSEDEGERKEIAHVVPVAPAPVAALKIVRPVAPAVAKPAAPTLRPSATRPLYAAWEDVRPTYVGPVEIATECAGIGGGRGYVASEDLEPGTLVLMEHVYVPWPASDVDQADPSFFIVAMESILNRPDAAAIAAHLRHLHPVQLSDLPADVLQAGRAKYGAPLEQLRERFASLGFSHDQLLQNVLGMQCNAFDSGVFLFNAIFNHDCNPNCVKFTPEKAHAGVSEVRVAQKIRKGEPLTISYLYPREQSRAKRRANLRDQFGFDCGCALCARGDSVLPTPLAPTDAALPLPTIADVEAVVATAEDLLKTRGDGTHVLAVALNALSDALEIVAHDHVVLIRIHKLVADCCDEILKSWPSQDVREYAILFLRSSYELLELQKTYLNGDHVDLARTLNDVSQGIQLLLALDAAVLLAEFPEWKDFREASFVENQYRQDYRRIKRLYE